MPGFPEVRFAENRHPHPLLIVQDILLEAGQTLIGKKLFTPIQTLRRGGRDFDDYDGFGFVILRWRRGAAVQAT